MFLIPVILLVTAERINWKSIKKEQIATVVSYSPGKNGHLKVRLENSGVFKVKSASSNGFYPKVDQQVWVKYDSNYTGKNFNCVLLTGIIDSYYRLDGVKYLFAEGQVLKWIKSSGYPDSRLVYEYVFEGKKYRRSQIIPKRETATIDEKVVGKKFQVRIWENRPNRAFMDISEPAS